MIYVTDGSGNELPADSFAYQISLKYRGYVYDSETGLYYLQSRYYDPETGRFLNADDVDYIGYSGEVLSYNTFAYCENDAVNGSDPSGNEKDKITKFAADLALIYGCYSVRRHRNGGKYYVSLGNSKIGVSKWANFFTAKEKFLQTNGYKVYCFKELLYTEPENTKNQEYYF